MDPRAALVRDRDDLAERIEAPVFTLPAWAQTIDRAVDARQDLAQRLGPHPALVVSGDRADPFAFPAESQHLE